MGPSAQRRRRASVASRGAARRSPHSRAHASSQVQFLRRGFPVAAAARPRRRASSRRPRSRDPFAHGALVPSHPGRERHAPLPRDLARARRFPIEGGGPRAQRPAPSATASRAAAAPRGARRPRARTRRSPQPLDPRRAVVSGGSPRGGLLPPSAAALAAVPTSPRARRLPAQVGGPSAAAARLASRLPQGRWSDAESQVVKSAGRCR